MTEGYVPIGGPQQDGVAEHRAADPEADARNRAARTFVQGLATDVAIAGALVITEALSSDDVDWRLLGLTLAKTVLMTGASYVYRRLRPPV